MQDRHNFVLDKIWECILPGHESFFETISHWLGEKNRVNPPNITSQEIMDSLKDYSALYLSVLKGYKTIRANIGPNVFHVSSFDSLESIAKEGIRLGSGDNDQSNILSPKEAVFLCKSPSYAACICGKAQNLDNQVVLEIKKSDLNLYRVDSMGHHSGLVKREEDLNGQLGSYEPIKPESIVKVYLNDHKYQDIPDFFKDKYCRVDAKLPCHVKEKGKNTWTRVIAESKSK